MRIGPDRIGMVEVVSDYSGLAMNIVVRSGRTGMVKTEPDYAGMAMTIVDEAR